MCKLTGNIAHAETNALVGQLHRHNQSHTHKWYVYCGATLILTPMNGDRRKCPRYGGVLISGAYTGNGVQEQLLGKEKVLSY